MTAYREPTPGLFRWRQRRAWAWFARQAYASGLISGYISSGHENRRGCITSGLDFGWSPRPYVLWLKREEWGYPLHWLRYRHWPRHVMGFCGICAPWPCCGATGEEHADDCEGDL